MLNSVRRVTPFALAFVLGVAGTAFAGDNADVTFSTASDTEVTGIGAGGTVSLSIAAAGMVGVKQFDVTVEFSPADAFDVNATKYSAPSDFIAPGQEVDGATLKIGAANFGGDISGDGSLGAFTFTALIHSNCSVINYLKERDDSLRLTIGTFDVCTQRSYRCPVVTETTCPFGEHGVIANCGVNTV